MPRDAWMAWTNGLLWAIGPLVSAYCVWLVRRGLARIPTPAEVERCVQWRLMELLPLPHLGDRGTLLELLRHVAPGRARAVFVLAEAPILLAREGGWDAHTPSDSRFVELHRATLARGQSVSDDRFGTLLPLFTREGRLSGVLAIGGATPVTLDDEARASLRCIAGWLDHALVADARARDNRRQLWGSATATTSAVRSMS